MELRPYQQKARESIENEWARGVKKTLLVLPTGCHARGERLLLASGKTSAVENIAVGDHLLGADGKKRTVLYTHHGEGALYKITPVKGETFIVTGDHKLSLMRTHISNKKIYPCCQGNPVIDISVNEYLEWSKSKKHVYKLFRAPAIARFENDFDPIADGLIDPHFLGVLLGDGEIRCLNITTMEPEIIQEIYDQAKKHELKIGKIVDAGKAKTYFFHEAKKLRAQLNALGLNRSINSGNKFVPKEYKYGPIKTRLEIIAGLIDTDGYLRKAGGYDFISKSKQLSSDLAFMCKSCGLAAYSKPCIKRSQNGTAGTYYRVSINGDCDIIPCRVKRRQSPERRQKKNVLVTGFTVEPFGEGEYFGFTVDGDNRYLLNDFTVTHNCGKTVVFSKVVEDRVEAGDRCLILAHRGELLSQASDKLYQLTGMKTSVEKADQTCLDSWYRVTVGSVQTLQREQRLAQFPEDYFGTIVVDEAHHSISDSYKRVLGHFPDAKVLGVTATPDRGDMRNLGAIFETLAFEYSLPEAIREGYLSKIKAQTIPLTLDLSSVGTSAGDFKASDLGSALDPYLEQIAEEMRKYCQDKKTVVFLPLVKTSKKFRDILNKHGFKAAEVNGNSEDREEVLQDFDDGKYNVLCNSMLLTEGWDCPSVDCIVVLRPTKIRSLYAQMIGRGTRLYPGKDHLLILDFLWHTERHQLCHPASLICKDEKVAARMTENLEDAGEAIDIEEAEQQAAEDVVADRERALAEQLKEMRSRKRKLVDPLQFEMSIQAEDLAGYVPTFGWQMAPPSKKQIETLEHYGIYADEIEDAGKAALILDRLSARRTAGLSTPKQIRFLERKGFLHVGSWQFDDASKMISRISMNGWRVPRDVVPEKYQPGGN